MARGLSLWGVTMVRDEIDILPYTLAHLDTQGLAGIIVADNMSTDGTWEYLHDVELATPLIVQRDTEVGYYQSRKMSALAHQAAGNGATWVIPFDADEVWRVAPQPGTPSTIADVLVHERWTSCVDCVQVPLYYYYPRATDDTSEPNPFLRIEHRNPAPQPLPKVIVRSRPDIVIEQGNHGAHGDTPLRTGLATSLEIAHFPFRGYDVFERKVINGYAAYRATDLPASVGAHWRAYGAMLEEHGPEVLRSWYEQWFVDPELSLEYRPVARGN